MLTRRMCHLEVRKWHYRCFNLCRQCDFSIEVGTGQDPLIPFDDELDGVYKIFGSKGTLFITGLTLYHQ